MAKVDAIQTKYSELLHEMKRLERDHAKSRKRADQLQKEKDQSRAEMQKAIAMKHKLETLCRELQKENKRIKVNMVASLCRLMSVLTEIRTRVRNWPKTSNKSARSFLKSLRAPFGRLRIGWKKKRTAAGKGPTWKLTNCTLHSLWP